MEIVCCYLIGPFSCPLFPGPPPQLLKAAGSAFLVGDSPDLDFLLPPVFFPPTSGSDVLLAVFNGGFRPLAPTCFFFFFLSPPLFLTSVFFFFYEVLPPPFFPTTQVALAGDLEVSSILIFFPSRGSSFCFFTRYFIHLSLPVLLRDPYLLFIPAVGFPRVFSFTLRGIDQFLPPVAPRLSPSPRFRPRPLRYSPFPPFCVCFL